MSTEQELRRSDGTQVPEPRMVTDIPVFSGATANAFFKSKQNAISYCLFE